MLINDEAHACADMVGRASTRACDETGCTLSCRGHADHQSDCTIHGQRLSDTTFYAAQRQDLASHSTTSRKGDNGVDFLGDNAWAIKNLLCSFGKAVIYNLCSILLINALHCMSVTAFTQQNVTASWSLNTMHLKTNFLQFLPSLSFEV